MNVNPEGLRQLIAAILRGVGSAPEEAMRVSSHLVEANLHGHDSHGVGLAPIYVASAQKGLVKPNVRGKVVRQDGAFLVVDAGHGFGQAVAYEAVATAIEQARSTGVVILSIRAAHHMGRIGSYAEQCAAAGLCFISFVNVVGHDPLAVPHNGAERRFSTNPVTIAIPATPNHPALILDFATTMIAVGKCRVAAARGEKLADGLVVDSEGRPSNDPAVMMSQPQGALLPMAQHKGSGLALMAEILAGAIAGGGTIQPANPRSGAGLNSMFAIIVDPARLSEHGWMNAEIDALIAYVKSSRPSDPNEPVQIAGEPELATRAVRLREGIPMDETTWAAILNAGGRVGLTHEICLDYVEGRRHAER